MPTEQVVELDKDTVFGQDKLNVTRKIARSAADIHGKREDTRQTIATIIVLSMLGIVVLAYITFILMIFFGGTDAPKFADLKDLTEAIIAPVVGVVGAVSGFYFGGKDSVSDRERGSSSSEQS